MNTLVLVSMVGLLLVSALWGRKTGEWRMLIAFGLGLAAFALFLNLQFGFLTKRLVAMGPQEDLSLWVALYVCMVAGMFAQYAYRHLGLPRRRRTKWDWGLFIAPIFASPIVFVPLATSCISGGLDLSRPSAAKLMIFLVAFQNGFFWKEFFDLKQKAAEEGK